MAKVAFKGDIFFCMNQDDYKNAQFLLKEPWISLDCKIINDEVKLITIGVKNKYFIFPLAGVELGTGKSDPRLNFLREILQNKNITKFVIKCEEQFWALTDYKYDISLDGNFYVDLTEYDSPAGNKAKQEIVQYSSKEYVAFSELGINWNSPTTFANNRAIHEKLVMIIYQIVENIQYWVKPGDKKEPVASSSSQPEPKPEPAPTIKANVTNVTCNKVDKTSKTPAKNVKPIENTHDGGKPAVINQPAPVNSSISDPAIIKAKVNNVDEISTSANYVKPGDKCKNQPVVLNPSISAPAIIKAMAKANNVFEAKAKSLPSTDKNPQVKATTNEIKSTTPTSTQVPASTYATKLSNGRLSCPSPTLSDSSNNSKSSNVSAYKILPIKWVARTAEFDETYNELYSEKVISLDCKLSENDKICLVIIGTLKKMYLINANNIQNQALKTFRNILLNKNALKLSFKTPIDVIIKNTYGIHMINYLDLNNCQCDEYKGFKFKNSLNAIISTEPQELRNLKFRWFQRPLGKDAQLLSIHAASYIIQNYTDIYSPQIQINSIDVVDGNVLKGSGPREKVDTNLNPSKSMSTLNQNVNAELKSNPINQINQLSSISKSKSETIFTNPFSVPMSSNMANEKEMKSSDRENNELEIKNNVTGTIKPLVSDNLDKIINLLKKAEEPQKANPINQLNQVPSIAKSMEISPNISKSDPLINLFAKPFSSGPGSMPVETNNKKKKSPEKKKNEPEIEIKKKETTTETTTTGTFKPKITIVEKHIGQGEIFGETGEKMPTGAEMGIGFDKMFDSTIRSSLDRIFKHTSAEIIKNNSGLAATAHFEERKSDKSVQTCFTGEIFCSKFLHDDEL